jgi:hypothetical protein
LREDRVDVLDSVRLINDDILETELLEYTFFDQADFVARDADLEVLRQKASCDNFRALFLGAREKGNVEVRSPLLEFARPVLQRRFWNNNKVKARGRALVLKISKEGYGLEGFAKALQVGKCELFGVS